MYTIIYYAIECASFFFFVFPVPLITRFAAKPSPVRSHRRFIMKTVANPLIAAAAAAATTTTITHHLESSVSSSAAFSFILPPEVLIAVISIIKRSEGSSTEDYKKFANGDSHRV